LQPASIAAWLTGTQPSLDGRRPLDVLARGEHEPVMTIARRVAERSLH
jgi:hypothetical protein